jgi:hypothetical protein
MLLLPAQLHKVEFLQGHNIRNALASGRYAAAHIAAVVDVPGGEVHRLPLRGYYATKR